MAYEPALTSVTYSAASTTAQPFIPGNCQAPTNSHDNPNNGTEAQRRTSCIEVSPLATTVKGENVA